MFVQAGFNDEEYRIVCAAFVRRYGRRWVRPSFLITWPCGDLAWGGDRGVSWPEQIRIVSVIPAGSSIDYPRSPLPQ